MTILVNPCFEGARCCIPKCASSYEEGPLESYLVVEAQESRMPQPTFLRAVEKNSGSKLGFDPNAFLHLLRSQLSSQRDRPVLAD